jgi:hypothetical protein
MKMRLLIACYMSVVFAVFGLFVPASGSAGIHVNINIPLPPLVIEGPPAMVVVPGTYAYVAPDVKADLYFYHGYWYRPSRGGWYASLGYNGPWGYVVVDNVPRVLINLPPHYRRVPPGYERMPYGTVRRNWRNWEEERYWDHSGKRQEHEDHDSDGYATPRHGHGMGMGMGMGMGRRGDD